ncbi:Hypp8021 [Branchiostoma lanceolatum]|uniref:Hypp8021 protein n=1 Tax=Branchiostoma lanceolatum TaxID=7740 RepID=A0A8J9Z555_BRALA|nr:Hypp8021 [Branchiostoma lanceolatum]
MVAVQYLPVMFTKGVFLTKAVQTGWWDNMDKMGTRWRLQGVPHLAGHMGVMCQCHVVAIATGHTAADHKMELCTGDPLAFSAPTSSYHLIRAPTAKPHRYS